MFIVKKEVLIYQTEEGKAPYEEWVNSLRDRKAAAKVRVRIDRVLLGNFGDCDSVGGGVYELCIDYGPGYRVYFAQEGRIIVILLCGGDKRTQSQDIKSAQEYWADYRRRRR
jgi:putative addiction module killer protein